ncbi:hypothetical protein HWV62_44617 [Athelia sp. TMB]|nr:hypothetical protein HWV62_44617 [Athelia sp. TMB]
MSKRTIDGFFSQPAQKKVKMADNAPNVDKDASQQPPSSHPTYPFPIPALPQIVADALSDLPAKIPRSIADQPDLDLLYFEPYFPPRVARALFEFLRRELFFYRVRYTIKRFGKETEINTPRFTTVFGLDATSIFAADGSVQDNPASPPNPKSKVAFNYAPRPLPECLNQLRSSIEAATNETFNFCLINYYASGADSIAYHSDDEHFLAANPTIASFSLGTKRDFLLKHKAPTPGMAPLKLPLASGDCVVMRGQTQPKWLHSIPKRAGKAGEGGRINITFRKAVIREGTNNYYHYNVGKGEPFKWSDTEGKMVQWASLAEK